MTIIYSVNSPMIKAKTMKIFNQTMALLPRRMFSGSS